MNIHLKLKNMGLALLYTKQKNPLTQKDFGNTYKKILIKISLEAKVYFG